MSFNFGENVGPYRIMEQLGQGGVATVFKAYHAALDRYVALKVLHPAFRQDPNFEARFQREARLVARLEHPNIVPIYDYAEHQGRPYLVMKYIEGDTLKARLARGPLTADEITTVVSSVGSALAYAHKQGILHRDIKPSNLLIGADGQMYLADFGLARMAQAAESTLSSDMIMGTPQYISPEQARGEKNLTEATDIYSFGVMLYEMVVGQVPYNADTPFSIIHDHIYSPLPMPRSLNPNVPEPVQRVLLKALAKEPVDRYPDVDSLVKAFKASWLEAGVPMQGTDITMRPTSITAAATVDALGEQAPPVRSRSPALAWIGALLLGVLCLGLLTFALIARGRLRASARLSATSLNPSPAALLLPAITKAPFTAPASVLPTQTPGSAVATALEAAWHAPGDPRATLALSLAYWDSGQFRLSLQTLDKAARLAGAGNTSLFRDAGDAFKQRQAWLPAAAMYRLAVRSLQSSGFVPDGLEDDFHESLYQAAALPDFFASLPFDKVATVEQPIAMVAQARHLYYNGDKLRAHQVLNQVMTLQPHMAEASLLAAEMDAAEGKTSDARRILSVLLADLTTPDWVRDLALTRSNQIP